MTEITHERARRLILEGEGLWSNDKNVLYSHLAICPDCRRYAGQIQALDGDLRDAFHDRLQVSLPSTSGLLARHRSRLLLRKTANLVGAAVVALLLISLVLFSNQILPLPVAATGAAPSRETTPTFQLFRPGPAPADFGWPILFESAQEGNFEIYRTTNGQDVTNLTQNPASDTDASWSPDGKWIAFLSSRGIHSDGTPGKTEIFVMDAQGQQVTQITADPAIRWLGPLAWSPDGKWLTVSGSPILGYARIDFYLVALDGSGARLIQGAGMSTAQWSPVEPLLALSPGVGVKISAVQSGQVISTIQLDTAHSQELPFDRFNWLADGRLAYLHFRQNVEHERQTTLIVDIQDLQDTSRSRQVEIAIDASLITQHNLLSGVSPDGKQVFLLGGQFGCFRLHLIPIDEPQKEVRLDNFCAGTEWGAPQWLPDSRWLVLPAWINQIGETRSLYLIDTQAVYTNPTKAGQYLLTETPTWVYRPQPATRPNPAAILGILPKTAHPAVPAESIIGPGACAMIDTGWRIPSTGFFTQPVNNLTVLADYSREHPAIDFATTTGEEVYAADGGVVVFAGSAERGYGMTVVLKHQLGYQTVYAHLQSAQVQCGQQVSPGERIGQAGHTGNATGSMLRFEVRLEGYPLNPWAVLDTAKNTP